VALRLACVCPWLTALAALPGGPAGAQGAFQSFYNPRSSRSDRYPSLSRYRSSYGWRPYSRYQPYEAVEELPQPYDRSGSVRTLCVRLCDGFYFPISSATTRSELAHDADKCSAICSVDAQLFYHSNAGGSVDTMVDLTGRAYSTLRNAFKYRHTLVPGCRCRPQPWSDAEQRRHRSYGRQPGVAVEDGGGAGGADGAATSQRLDGRTAETVPIDRARLEHFDASDATSSRSTFTDDAGVADISRTLISRPEPIERQTQGTPSSWYRGSRRWGTSPYR